jgi:hypothetical protein
MIHITEAPLQRDHTAADITVENLTTAPDRTTEGAHTPIGANASGWRRSGVVLSGNESVLNVSVSDRTPIVRHRRDLRPSTTDVQQDSLQVRISAPKRSESGVVKISVCQVAWVVCRDKRYCNAVNVLTAHGRA